MKRLVLIIMLLGVVLGSAMAQYAPQVGLPGCDAISASNPQIVAWGTQCVLMRGYLDIADASLGLASNGDSSAAIGAADGRTVSLGDSGVAEITFGNPIINGAGPDFAVFENGFRNVADSAQSYMELGFVEVSSDGIHYFRFPSVSLTPSVIQVGNANYMDASKIKNLAGKYLTMYGTPFDLEELTGIIGLDVNNITHVRIVDVVGDIGSHGSQDQAGHKINDPYPTPFPSCGFDLDAVGVLHQACNAIPSFTSQLTLNVYPNPADDYITIALPDATPGICTLQLTTITGNVVKEVQSLTTTTLPLAGLASGMYYLTLIDSNGNRWAGKIIKR